MKIFKKISVFILMTFIAATSMLCFGTSTASAAGKTYKIMIINFDPTFNVNGKAVKQHELMSWWNDPYKLAEEYAKDMSDVSYGNVNYTIAEKYEINELPRSTTGAQYTTSDYYKTLMAANKATDGAYWNYTGWKDFGFTFDYESYLKKYDVFNKVNSGKIDEVWFFTGPMVGVTLNETRMFGKDAFWVNGEESYQKDCRNFIVYGFNYERGVGEMLEDSGHRMECIMANIFGWPNYNKDYSQFNEWEKFTAYDKVAPGKAGVGNVHFAPNSTKDYDWGNTSSVSSYCANWLNYPDISGAAKKYTCSEWGNGDIREHHKWWFKHIPHAVGKNARTGFYNNWWTYFTLDYLNCPPAAKYNITTCSFSSVANATYTGSPIKPAVTVKHGSKALKSGTDYTINYSNNTNAGTAAITITGQGNYVGTKKITFKILPKDVAQLSYSAIKDQTYTGKAINPALTIKYGSVTLKNGTDYTYNPANNTNAGQAIITIIGHGNYTGIKSVFFNIKPKDISTLSYSSIPNQKYTGKPIKPALTVKYGSITLKNGVDYTYNPGNNTNKGQAIIMLFGHGNYTGSKSVFFNIV